MDQQNAQHNPGSEFDADVVVGFGGYVATPAYLAARKAGVPIVIHEQNARPGLANRLGARVSRTVGTTFASTDLPHAVRVGLPLRMIGAGGAAPPTVAERAPWVLEDLAAATRSPGVSLASRS